MIGGEGGQGGILVMFLGANGGYYLRWESAVFGLEDDLEGLNVH